MHGGLLAAAEGGAQALALGFGELLILISNSVATGLCLVIATYFFNRSVEKAAPGMGTVQPEAQGSNEAAQILKPAQSKRHPIVKRILGAANQLFLTVGLTGILLLVNNNIVRAFAIYAAIALVRFKVSLDAKNINAAFFFSVIAGIACGLHELRVAWVMTAVYAILITLLIGVIRYAVSKHKVTRADVEKISALITRSASTL